jgi:DNA-binding transcriptional LysR family regulator
VARHGEPKVPADLSKHTCLVHTNLDPNDRAWRLHHTDHVLSVKIIGGFSSNSALVLRKAALAGLGVGYLPLYCIEDDLKNGALLRLLPKYSPPQRPIYVVYPPAVRVPERVRTFVDFLATWFGNTSRVKWQQYWKNKNVARGEGRDIVD